MVTESDMSSLAPPVCAFPSHLYLPALDPGVGTRQGAFQNPCCHTRFPLQERASLYTSMGVKGTLPGLGVSRDKAMQEWERDWEKTGSLVQLRQVKRGNLV